VRWWKLVLPWRYVALLAVGLVVLWVLVSRFGRTAPVLFGWLVGWLVVSRVVEFVVRRRRRRTRIDDEAKIPPSS
jgi:hypothetical protein